MTEMERPAGSRRVKAFRPPSSFLAAERLAGVERGLKRLASEDRELARVIAAAAKPLREP